MKDRKIVIALSSLSIYELNSFIKYINSPYFNANQHITNFCTLLINAIKAEKVESLTPESVWQLLFPDEEFQNQKFLKLNSDLVKLLEHFICQLEFDQSESLKTNLKIEGVRKRNMENLYNGILGEIERLQKTEINQSAEYYLTKYQIENNIFSLKTENEKKNEKFEITSALNIKDISENLDLFYIAAKLRLFCTLLSWQKMYKLDIEMLNMENVFSMANSFQYQHIPAISVYTKIHLTYIDEDNLKNYQLLRDLIKTNIYKFPENEQWEIYSTAISYCINRVNKGDLSFQLETFSLYKEAIESQIILFDQNISQTTFRNIVQIATRVEEFAWAENFIQDYAKFVDEKYRSNAVEFSLARVEFYRKKYGKVLEHLYRVTYEDVWYNINAKTLQIASYYELKEYDALESLLQAFKMYIRREKSLSGDRKIHYLNLIKFTSALMKINAKEQDKVIKLKNEISETKGVVSKPWLIEKVNEMIKVKK